MKYYRKKERTAVDYTESKFQPCWTCKNACSAGCNWSREFTPVDGWKAIPTYIPENGEHANSYKIIYCPEYKKEVRR